MRARLTAFMFAILGAAGRCVRRDRAAIFPRARRFSLSRSSAHAARAVPTNQSYVDDLHAFYRFRFPGLRLAKLVFRETTTNDAHRRGVLVSHEVRSRKRSPSCTRTASR